jgi:hypothetical protein
MATKKPKKKLTEAQWRSIGATAAKRARVELQTNVRRNVKEPSEADLTRAPRDPVTVFEEIRGEIQVGAVEIARETFTDYFESVRRWYTRLEGKTEEISKSLAGRALAEGRRVGPTDDEFNAFVKEKGFPERITREAFKQELVIRFGKSKMIAYEEGKKAGPQEADAIRTRTATVFGETSANRLITAFLKSKKSK